ncbi:hypothetical protein VI817_003823 [Penicillium citrinum]|nr:hypothetical protein VI817_003823 [Penicillium citrinum]
MPNFGDRPHACDFCGSAFNRKDVLRRHEKTCRARCPSAMNDSAESQVAIDPQNYRESKRHHSSMDSNLEQGVLSFSEAEVVNSQVASHPVGPAHHDQRFTSIGESQESKLYGNHSGPKEFTWPGHEPALFNMLSQFDNVPNMTSPLDFAFLDCIMLPETKSDISTAERLEFMAYFTSARGMSTFADREDFRRRQEMAREAVEMQLERYSKGSQALDDPFTPRIPDSKKSKELVSALQNIICNKKNDDVITLDWTPETSRLCIEFFQPLKTLRFVRYFWSLWYPHCPIVHKPLFDTSSASTELLCVMIIIGACLSPEENDRKISKLWLDSVEELIFCQLNFQINREVLLDHPDQRKEVVQCLQAAYLVSSLQKREGSSEAQARMRRHRHASLVTLVRHAGLGNASHRNLDLTHASESWWQQFAVEEEFIRTVTFVFLIDAALTILHNSPPRMVVTELKMDLACPESCFQAESASACMQQMQNWAGTMFWERHLSIMSVARQMCQSPFEETLVQNYAGLGTLNLFTIIQAIHCLLFHLHNSLVFESTIAPIQTGLENWRRIWSLRVPEDIDIPDTPENLWKQVGFLSRASEFWQLARLFVGKIMTASQEDQCNAEEPGQLSRYDHTDMGEVNDLIMEYRKMSLGVS